jgi:DNA-binding transcriptional regulator YiaG
MTGMDLFELGCAKSLARTQLAGEFGVSTKTIKGWELDCPIPEPMQKLLKLFFHGDWGKV